MENLWPNIATGKPFGKVLPNVRQQEASTFELAEGKTFAEYISQAAIAAVSARGLISAADLHWISCASIAVLIRAQQLRDHVQEIRPAVVAARNP